MNSTHLNEHDANQGAQSSGEFLGMTGNSGWYLLGSGGATILMVILLWGILGVSLLLCLLVGIVLCLLSVAYVFALKNNRPAHYDTDFFEAALVESLALADRSVLAAVFKSEAIPAGERLHPENVVAALRARGLESAVYADADAIVAAIAPELRKGDVVAILSNGGFGGIYEKLPKAIAGLG